MVEAFHMLGASEVAMEARVHVEATALRVPFADAQKEFQWAEPLRQLVLQQVQEQGGWFRRNSSPATRCTA